MCNVKMCDYLNANYIIQCLVWVKMSGMGGLENIKLFCPFWIHKPILDIYKCPKLKIC